MAGGDLISGISLIIISVLFGLCLIFYTRKFHSRHNETIYIKRRGNIVIIYSIFSIILLLLGIPFVILIKWSWNSSSASSPLLFNEKSTTYLILDCLNDFLYVPPFQLQAFIILCRYWMIYYDIQFTASCRQLEWKKCITNNIKSLRAEQWYIENRSKYGNASYALKRAILSALIASFLTMVFTWLRTFGVTDLPIYYVFSIFVFLSLLIAFIVLWRKMPPSNDIIYLYKEFQLISIFGFLSIITFIVANAVTFLLGTYIMTSFVGQFSTMFATFIIPFVSTFWVVKQMRIREEKLRLHSMDSNQPESLRQILENMDILNLFMAHLGDEFSMESLLALIEFYQFRTYAEDKFMVKDEDDLCEMKNVDFNFPQDLPRSDIVFNDINVHLKDTCNIETNSDSGDDQDLIMRSFKIKAYQLYKKYVDSGGEFEINISYESRMTLEHLMTNYEKWISDESKVSEKDMTRLYDECMLELIKLLNHSRQRFKCQIV